MIATLIFGPTAVATLLTSCVHVVQFVVHQQNASKLADALFLSCQVMSKDHLLILVRKLHEIDNVLLTVEVGYAYECKGTPSLVEASL